MMPLSADRPAGYRQAFPLSIRADGLIHLPGHGSCNLNDEFLRSMGIDPKRALQELHVTIEDQKTVAEIDAYVLLMRKVPLLKPLAWLIDLPLIRPFLSRVYHRRVNRKLG